MADLPGGNFDFIEMSRSFRLFPGDGVTPIPAFYSRGERIIAQLREVGIRGRLQTMERGIFFQHLDVIRGLLARGVGVDLAAHRLNLLGNLHGAARRRALERHVFEEVRDAVLGRGFTARAGTDIGAERHCLHPLHPFGHDGQAIRQARDLNWFGHGRNFPWATDSPAYGVPKREANSRQTDRQPWVAIARPR